MIPKTIHYVWFGGGSKNELINKCMASWGKYLPDYEIREWSEKNFDISENKYALQAYESRKWAFVSDYVRLKVLSLYGGVYLDTDVEILRSLDRFLDHGAFTGFEKYRNTYSPITAVMGANSNHPWIAELLSEYDNIDYETDYTNTARITQNLNIKHGIINSNLRQSFGDVVIYPAEYFCVPSAESYAVHHYNGSWLSRSDKLKKYVRKITGIK